MYKLLLVGVEKYVRDILLQNNQCNRYGICEVLETQDSVVALEIIKESKPNIIFVNIDMMVIERSKLTLIIKEICKDIILIVIGEYEKSLFFKNASNLVAFEYIFKQINENELNNVILRAVESLNQNKIGTTTVHNIRKTAIKNGLFARLINSFEEPESIYKMLRQIGVEMEFTDYFITVFYLTENYKKYNLESEFIYLGISQIIDELCCGVIPHYFISDYCGFNIVLAVENLKSESEQVNNLFDHIRYVINDFFDISVIVGVSRNHHSLGEMGDAYHEAYEQLLMQKYCGFSVTTNTDQGGITDMFMEKKKSLMKSIYACDRIKAHTIINYIYDMECRAGLPVKQIKVMNSLLLNGLVLVVSDIVNDKSIAYSDSQDIYVLLNKMKSLENTKQFLIDITDELIASLIAKNIEDKNKLLKLVITFTEKNFNKDLSLNYIAEKFDIDSITLNKMFKEEMGQSFSRYMIDLKIKKAKLLLVNTSMKVYEIVNYVGYNDIKYFNKIFKQLVGVTPLQYRKVQQKQNDIKLNYDVEIQYYRD